MSGDDLAIRLFFWACAVPFGIEVMKAEAPSRKAFFGSSFGACLILGLFWAQIGPTWPALSAKIAVVAANPESWFVIYMFVAAILAFQPAKPKRTTNRLASTAPAHVEAAPATTEKTTTPVIETPKTPSATDIIFKKIGDRDVMENAADYLFWLRRSMSSVRAGAMLAPYIGKWIKVTGRIGDVRDTFVSLNVKDESGNSFMSNSVFLSFDDKWKDRFHMLDRNMFITVIGELEAMGGANMDLKNCEIAPDVP
jgi:hypothetical protein